MEELGRHGDLGLSALRSGMDRKTARRYVKAARLPSELRPERDWRTRPNPFEEDWPSIVASLETAPALEAKTIFEGLCERHPERYQPGQLRTLQRQIRRWRAQCGPPKEVFFGQAHRPGEAMQTDFTWGNGLMVTIGGDPFDHLIAHSVLPYSNWESATVCRSESIEAVGRAMQTALSRLGRAPEFHQTDNSTAATHRLGGGGGTRAFNSEYLKVCAHFGMKARTTGIGKKEQNGDVEALNGALKRRLEQRLLASGSRDFEGVASYEAWLWADCQRANARRRARITEELEVMRPLPSTRLPEYRELRATVSSASTIRVRNNTYSVPSRLIGEQVQIRISDYRLEVYFAGTRELDVERLRGEGKHRVNYRHIIDSLLRKSGAFERYRYRDDLFPGLAFRRAYDALRAHLSERDADINYLRILNLAAKTMETVVEAALADFESRAEVPLADRIKSAVAPTTPAVPALDVIRVDLTEYDGLLEDREELSA